MNTNLNGFRELTAGDLDRVSGGTHIITIPVRLVEKLAESTSFVAALREKATGTLKGIKPR